MAASKDKAQALKNSYVDGIIDELGGASDPAVRMAIREGDQASVHSFPDEDKGGGINDGDPNLYIHGRGGSYKVDTDPSYANPVTDQGPGGRNLMDLPQDALDGSNDYLDKMERRMGGSGDVARLGPRSLEEFNRRNPGNRPPEKRTIQRRDRSSAGGFDSSNLAGAMGMEQGNTAGAVFDLENGILLRKNDGNPRLVIRDGSRRSVQADYANAANPLNAGYGAEDVTRLHPRDMAGLAAQLHGGGNNVDTTIYDGPRDVANQYKEQMYQSYTR
jgi:hypothetical protein